MKQNIISLNKAQKNKKLTVVLIEGAENQIRNIRNLGIKEGEKIKILNKSYFLPIKIARGCTRLGICRQMAEGIMVTEDA